LRVRTTERTSGKNRVKVSVKYIGLFLIRFSRNVIKKNSGRDIVLASKITNI
jgi:hypothetical protein